MQEPKLITILVSKGKSVGGHSIKLKCFIYDNGVSIFQKFLLAKCTEKIPFFEILTTKFGLTLYVQEFSFKYSTLYSVTKEIQNKLTQNAEKLTTIL